MAGYNYDEWKSTNAILAEEDGLLKLSQLSAWQKRAVKAGAVQPQAWHHTSSWYNKTDYFDPADFDELNPSDFPAVKKASEEEREVVVYRTTFTGSRYTRFVAETEKCVAIYRSGFYYFADGKKQRTKVREANETPDEFRERKRREKIAHEETARAAKEQRDAENKIHAEKCRRNIEALQARFGEDYKNRIVAEFGGEQSRKAWYLGKKVCCWSLLDNDTFEAMVSAHRVNTLFAMLRENGIVKSVTEKSVTLNDDNETRRVFRDKQKMIGFLEALAEETK